MKLKQYKVFEFSLTTRSQTASKMLKDLSDHFSEQKSEQKRNVRSCRHTVLNAGFNGQQCVINHAFIEFFKHF